MADRNSFTPSSNVPKAGVDTYQLKNLAITEDKLSQDTRQKLNYAKKSNLIAVTAPTASDDLNGGYEITSVWVDTNADLSYICVDATIGAAVWLVSGASSTASGEVNTGSNVNVGGVGVFKQKSGADLQFKGVNASLPLSVSDDIANNEIDITIRDATSTLTGVASFNDNDFDVITGIVSLEDSVAKQITADSGTTIPSIHSFSIVGSTGINTSATGSTVTISGSVTAHTDLTDMPDTNGNQADHDPRYTPHVGTSVPTTPTNFMKGQIFFDESVSGGIIKGKITVVTKTTDFTVPDSSSLYVVLVDATAGDVTITLYTAVNNLGNRVVVKKIDSSTNNMIIDTFGSETIDDLTSITDNIQYNTYTTISSDVDWFKI